MLTHGAIIRKKKIKTLHFYKKSGKSFHAIIREWGKISYGDKSTSSQTFNYFLSICSGKAFFSFQLVGNINSHWSLNLGNFKCERLNYKVLLSNTLGRSMHLGNGNQMQGIEPFPHNMNATVLILVYLQNSKSDILLSNFSWPDSTS